MSYTSYRTCYYYYQVTCQQCELFWIALLLCNDIQMLIIKMQNSVRILKDISMEIFHSVCSLSDTPGSVGD